MKRRFLSPGDSSGNGDGSAGDEAAEQALAAQSAASSDQSGQQDWKKLYDTNKSQSDKALAEAEKRRANLHSTFTKEQEAHKATQDALDTLRTQFDSTVAEKTAAMSSLTIFESSIAEKEKELIDLRKKNVRAGLIFEKFPHLASFEAKKLLPDAPDEELEGKFQLFSDEIGIVKEKSIEEFGSGKGIKQPDKDDKVPDSIKTLQSQLSELALAGSWKEYDKVYDSFLKLKETLDPK